MFSASVLPRAQCLLKSLGSTYPQIPLITNGIQIEWERRHNMQFRRYAETFCKKWDGCRRAVKDIPKPEDPECPLPCKGRWTKRKGLLQKIKLKIVEGGTNFGTPFRRLKPPEEPPPKRKPKALPEPKSTEVAIPKPRPGVQVSILGADTPVGQYVALLLKQCPCIRKLRLYEASDSSNNACTRDMYKVVQDLQHIDTNCLVQAFSCKCCDLEMCLQNTDIVLMLESASANINMPFEQRFMSQAPLVKRYADGIAHECPKAFVIVCATPVDCMVPLVAETLKETGWYDRRKLMGSMAVPEMRASTLAARALALEPRYTRVPCVGGSEGPTLVPLFSKAVSFFDFSRHNAEMMTETVRNAPFDLSRCDCCCLRQADLSEAHALAGLVKSVAHALLCHDTPRLSGFVETDHSQVVSPARFMANKLEINGSGIMTNMGLPPLSDIETQRLDHAIRELNCRYLAVDVRLNRHGICKRYDVPGWMSNFELDLMDCMWCPLQNSVEMAKNWYRQKYAEECAMCQTKAQSQWHIPRHYHHLDECNVHLTGFY